MKPGHPTTVGRHLIWLQFQTLLLMPMVLGRGALEGLAAARVDIWLLQTLLAAVIGIFIVRNVVRLWWAPSAEASAWTAMPLLGVGVLFLLMSSGPLIEGQRISTQPTGLALLTIGVVQVFLGLRDAVRIRPSAIRGTYWQ